MSKQHEEDKSRRAEKSVKLGNNNNLKSMSSSGSNHIMQISVLDREKMID